MNYYYWVKLCGDGGDDKRKLNNNKETPSFHRITFCSAVNERREQTVCNFQKHFTKQIKKL